MTGVATQLVEALEQCGLCMRFLSFVPKQVAGAVAHIVLAKREGDDAEVETFTFLNIPVNTPTSLLTIMGRCSHIASSQ